jgi:hypothetical protein
VVNQEQKRKFDTELERIAKEKSNSEKLEKTLTKVVNTFGSVILGAILVSQNPSTVQEKRLESEVIVEEAIVEKKSHVDAKKIKGTSVYGARWGGIVVESTKSSKDSVYISNKNINLVLDSMQLLNFGEKNFKLGTKVCISYINSYVVQSFGINSEKNTLLYDTIATEHKLLGLHEMDNITTKYAVAKDAPKYIKK